MALGEQMRQRCFRALVVAGGHTGFLPSSYQVALELKKQRLKPNHNGCSSNVWKTISPSGAAFALKVFRVIMGDDILRIRKVQKIVLACVPFVLSYVILSGSVRRC